MTIAGILILLIYAWIILHLTVGWNNLKSQPSGLPWNKKTVSILIPARNEAHNLPAILSDLTQQSYPKTLIEIIVINDASTDKTENIVNAFADAHTVAVKYFFQDEIKGYPAPKKRALETGIKQASGEIILTTDADCRVSENWVTMMCQPFKNQDVQFVSGPVKLHPVRNAFEKIQALEFLSLIGAGAGAIGKQKSLMCNGANLAFRRKAFEEVGGYAGNDRYTSGDDVFLMYKMIKKFGVKGIWFNKTPESIVSTRPQPNIKAFFQQRIRWASKSRGYPQRFSKWAALIVFLMNFWLFLFTIYSLVLIQKFDILAAFWGLKTIFDVPLLVITARFCQQKKLLWWLLPTQVFVVIYTSLTGIMANLATFAWKGRKYKQ
jgi:cellulose synthase/poly-beta-1,6-N-acetylglucosamine synthase-like glycosyltransferase